MPKLMLIEPHSGMLQTILSWFSCTYPGFRIFACRTEKEALDILNQQSVDFILFSIERYSPEQITIMQNLKFNNPQAKVVLLTAVEDELAYGILLEAGADACIAKVNIFKKLTPILNQLISTNQLDT